MVRFLVKELEEHYLTAKTDMMLAAKTKPVHGENSEMIHNLRKLGVINQIMS